MTPDSLERMQAIFEAAVDLPASERHAYLSRACDGDAQLRAQVARLIAADDETDTIGGTLNRNSAPSAPESIRECSSAPAVTMSRFPRVRRWRATGCHAPQF
jgi:hypothetical protein